MFISTLRLDCGESMLSQWLKRYVTPFTVWLERTAINSVR